MSLAAACGVTVLRSLVISLVGVLFSRHFSSFIETRYSKSSFLLLILILAPLLVPELILGYAWSQISLKLVHYPSMKELVYSSLVLVKVIPVGIICFYFSAPALISREADFIRKSANSSSTQIARLKTQCSFFFWKYVIQTVPIGALLFLLAFQEFEIASLIYRDSWTVWIFDAYARGVSISKSFLFLSGPLLIELSVIIVAVLCLNRIRNQPISGSQTKSIIEFSFSSLLAWIYLWTAFGVAVVIPFCLTGWSGVIALGSLIHNQLQLMETLRECAWGMLYGITSAIAAWSLASFFFSSNQTRSLKIIGYLLCLPGLCGSLTLGVVLAKLYLSTSAYWLYDTPLALLIALTLFLFPRAAFLKLIILSSREYDALFLLRLLSQSNNQLQVQHGRLLRWRLNGNIQYWAVVILAFWSYWDVTISSILAPNSTMTSSVRLYGLMHYGQNSVLSAITFLSLCIPVLLSFFLLPIVKKLWITASDYSSMNKTA